MHNKVKVTREGLNRAAKKAIQLGRLANLVDELIELLLDKNAQYKDAWQDFGIFTPLIRVREKIIRMESLIDGRPVLVYDDDVKSELMDIAGYCLLAILWMEESQRDDGDGITFQEVINHLREDARK